MNCVDSCFTLSVKCVGFFRGFFPNKKLDIITMASQLSVTCADTFISRVNTVAIDLRAALPPDHRVKAEEWQSLLLHDLKVKAVDVLEAMIHYRTGLLLVGFKEEKGFNEALTKLANGVSWSKLDVMVFGWSVLENVVDVQVLGVSIHHDPDMIIEKLKEFGQVVRWSKGMHSGGFKNAFNGMIFVKMRLDDGATLPAFVRLMKHGETIQIRSEAIEKTCHRCLGKGHLASRCQKPAATVKEGIRAKTWAMIAAGQAAPAAGPPSPDVTAISSSDDEDSASEDRDALGSDMEAPADSGKKKRSRGRKGKKRISSGGSSPPPQQAEERYRRW